MKYYKMRSVTQGIPEMFIFIIITLQLFPVYNKEAYY